MEVNNGIELLHSLKPKMFEKPIELHLINLDLKLKVMKESTMAFLAIC